MEAARIGNQPKALPNQQIVDAGGNVFYADPATGKNFPTGIRTTVPQGKLPYTLKDLTGIETRGFNGESFGVLPGYEDIEAAKTAAISNILGVTGGSPPVMSPTDPIQVPAPVAGSENMTYEPQLEEQISQMQSMTGAGREEVIAYLRQKGIL